MSKLQFYSRYIMGRMLYVESITCEKAIKSTMIDEYLGGLGAPLVHWEIMRLISFSLNEEVAGPISRACAFI